MVDNNSTRWISPGNLFYFRVETCFTAVVNIRYLKIIDLSDASPNFRQSLILDR